MSGSLHAGGAEFSASNPDEIARSMVNFRYQRTQVMIWFTKMSADMSNFRAGQKKPNVIFAGQCTTYYRTTRTTQPTNRNANQITRQVNGGNLTHCC
jgi:hypothetical protein